MRCRAAVNTSIDTEDRLRLNLQASISWEERGLNAHAALTWRIVGGGLAGELETERVERNLEQTRRESAAEIPLDDGPPPQAPSTSP